jgi:hypothetical protein
MNDTSPDIEKIARSLMEARSGGERMIMSASMFDAARAIVLASLPEDLSEEDSRRKLFERMYGATIEEVVSTVRDTPAG